MFNKLVLKTINKERSKSKLKRRNHYADYIIKLEFHSVFAILPSYEKVFAIIIRPTRSLCPDINGNPFMSGIIFRKIRRLLFGKVEDGAMVLSPLGERVLESLEAIPAYNPGIALYGHVVMPDHVHLRCYLASGLAEPLRVLGHAIRRFKNHTTKVYRELSASAEPSSALFTPGGSDIREDGRTEFGHLL